MISLSICFFIFVFFIDLSNFYSNQTKPKKKKKKFQIPENKLPEIYFAVDPCPPFQIHSLQPVRRPRSRVREITPARSRSFREIAPSRDRDVDCDLTFARSRSRILYVILLIKRDFIEHLICAIPVFCSYRSSYEIKTLLFDLCYVCFSLKMCFSNCKRRGG